MGRGLERIARPPGARGGCAAAACGAGTAVAQDPGTIPTGTEAACLALVQGCLEGAYGVPGDEQYAADRKGCDLPVKR
ncbi:hypothetical protein [Kitasatospora sp. NPDC054795]